MIDLSIQVKKYEIKWFDGQILHLDLPTQGLLMKIVKIEELDEMEQFDTIVEVLGDILNSNSEGRVITKEEVQSIPFNLIQLILTDYVNSVSNSLGE